MIGSFLRGKLKHIFDECLILPYTLTNSNGATWQKFKAYLGKCIDNTWHDGWEPDTQDTGIDLDAVRDRFKQKSEPSLKSMADAGNVYALEELERRKLSMSD